MFKRLNKIALRYLESGDPLRPSDENSSFWFRRFSTSLSLGNGAGLIAVAGLLQVAQRSSSSLSETFAFFAVGTVFSGALPLFLALRTWLKKPKPPVVRRADKDEFPDIAQYKYPILGSLYHFIAVNLYFVVSSISALMFILGIFCAWESIRFIEGGGSSIESDILAHEHHFELSDEVVNLENLDINELIELDSG